MRSNVKTCGTIALPQRYISKMLFSTPHTCLRRNQETKASLKSRGESVAKSRGKSVAEIKKQNHRRNQEAKASPKSRGENIAQIY
jgi:hypothetical protein